MSKYLAIVIVCLVVLATGLGVYYFQKTKAPTEGETEQRVQNVEPVGPLEASRKPEPSEISEVVTGKSSLPESQNQVEEKNQEIMLVKNGFSVLIPDGWKETGAPAGVSAMVSYVDEQIADPAVKKINFKTYYSVQYDVLQGQALVEYAGIVKNQLGQVIPEISFQSQEAIKINNYEAYTLEAELNQQGVDFKVLMIIIKGNQDDVWTIAFNTPKSKWQEYQDLFQSIAKSFEVK
ncbi:MAG: hypothetical protein AB1721_01440 [Patescibacteria group bacterium]